MQILKKWKVESERNPRLSLRSFADRNDVDIAESTLRGWLKKRDQLRTRLRRTRKHHPGPLAAHVDFEKKILDWIVQIRNGPTPICINRDMVILHALKLDRTFKEGNYKKLKSWVQKFLCRHRNTISIRTVTSKSAKIALRMESDEVNRIPPLPHTQKKEEEEERKRRRRKSRKNNNKTTKKKKKKNMLAFPLKVFFFFLFFIFYFFFFFLGGGVVLIVWALGERFFEGVGTRIPDVRPVIGANPQYGRNRRVVRDDE